MSITYNRVALVLALAGALTLALGAAQAFAATNIVLDADPESSTLEIDDQTNDDDVVNVSESSGTITITDTGTGGITTADTDCALVNATTVTCPVDPVDPAPPAPPTAPVRDLELDLDVGTDSFVNQNFVADVFEADFGQAGNKTITSGPGRDFIETGTGNDVVDLGAGQFNTAATGDGNDTITGGPGEDDAEPGMGDDVANTLGGRDDIDDENSFPNGADTLDGGDGGADEIDYDNEGVTGVTITSNGQPDDGHPGEGDNVLNMEELNGTDNADVIAGSDALEDINAAGGNDVVSGGGGDDEIGHGEGDDTVDGGEGADLVESSSTDDGADQLAGGGGAGDHIEYCCGIDPVTINQNGQPDDGHPGEGDNLASFEGFEGGDGDDSITGDDSPNQFIGHLGNDFFVGLGGSDQFIAGDGDDTINALGGGDEVGCGFGFDTVAVDAEDVLSGGCERSGAEVASDSAGVNKKGKAKVRVSCPALEGAACNGKLALLSGGKQIAKGSYKVNAGGEKNVTAKLSKKGRKALSKSKGRLMVSAEARTNEPPGVSTRAEDLLLTK